jgi:iron(III) transport system permease protein
MQTSPPIEAPRTAPASAARPRLAGRGARRGGQGRPPRFLLVPAVAVAVLTLLPVAYLALRAGEAGERAWAVAAETQTIQTLANTVLLAAVVTAASIALAVPIAWLTTRTDLPGRRAFAVLTALPLVVPTFVGGFAYVAAFGPRGMLQGLLAPLGVERLPEIYGLGGAALTLTLFSYPYLLLTVRGALLGMDPSLEEASRGLGHGARETFRRVTLPQLRPAVAAGSLLVALYVLSDFGAVSLLRFSSFTRVIFVQYQAGFDRVPAAVLALWLVGLTVTLLAIEAYLRGRRRFHRCGAGAQRRPPAVYLGAWRWPAAAFCGAVVALALVVPLTVLSYWLVRGLHDIDAGRLGGVALAAWNSIQAAGLAAAVAVLAALPVAVLSVRHRGRLTGALERATYLGFGLPGLVIALGLVFFGARYGGPLYQTLAMLVAAYVVLFLPQAVGSIRSSLLQVPPSIEEAARSLGRSGPATLLAVTAPLMRPGIVAGAALVFLTAMKELPAALLLGPIGYSTLATQVWHLTAEAFFARAALPGLVLLLLSSVPLAYLLARRDQSLVG